MTSVRVAGLVRSQEAARLQHVASLMEVATWIHRVSLLQVPDSEHAGADL